MLEKIAREVQDSGLSHLNINKELSFSLLNISAYERSRFSQNWMLETLATFQNSPIMCTSPDLLFEPSLKIDPLALFRQCARIKQLVVLWPGEYSAKTLSYAVPEHHHFRTWKVTDSMLLQPVVVIHRISTSQGV